MPQYGGGTVRGGYAQAQNEALQRRAMDMQNTVQGMNVLSTVSQNQERIKQQQEMEQLKPLLAQFGGDPEKTIRALLSTGSLKAIELASKLKGMIPAQDAPFNLSPGQRRFDAQGRVIAEVPPTPEKRTLPPIAQAAEYLQTLPPDHPTRPYIEKWLASQGGAKSNNTRTIQRGELSVTEELQQDGTWKEIGSGPKFAKSVPGISIPPQPRNLQLTTDAEGNQLIVNPDGTTRPLTTETGTGVKKPVAADRPMTEFQGKAALYGTRSAQSDKVLRSLEDKISTAGLAAGQATGVIGNALMSSEQRRVDQAQRDFVNAVLRQESGAVISDAEFANAKKQYFPQPGDDKNTVDQKRANRQLAIQGFARMAGPKGAVDIKAVLDAPLLPGVDAISPTPQQAGGKTGGYVEIRKTADGRTLGKKADGTIEEIKQ